MAGVVRTAVVKHSAACWPQSMDCSSVASAENDAVYVGVLLNAMRE